MRMKSLETALIKGYLYLIVSDDRESDLCCNGSKGKERRVSVD